jgi:cell division protein FtsI (penicillin-binding protein 3)
MQKAFSNEVAAGSRRENATKQESKAVSQLDRSGNRSRPPRPTNGPPAIPIRERRRVLVAWLGLIVGFGLVAGQLGRLAMLGQSGPVVAPIQAIGQTLSRPDIIDRTGRLLATDISVPSIFADPSAILDLDETIESLAGVLEGLDPKKLRKELADRSKQFVWIRRGVHPSDAKVVHELGLPGVYQREELHRVYPAAELTGHVLGFTDVDNRGQAGIERMIDQRGLSELAGLALTSERPPVVLSLDLSVQLGLGEVLGEAMADYRATGAAGIVLNVETGEVVAQLSLPDFAAGDAKAAQDAKRADRITGGTYELGSVFKPLTLAMAYDAGTAQPDKQYDATRPLEVDRFEIDDLHPERRWLTPEEVLLYSSNIGAAQMALEVGEAGQRRFLKRLGLLDPIVTEIGPTASPQVPARWSKASVVTIAYGHGLAVAPLQFVAAMASIAHGGRRVVPTYLRRRPSEGPRVLMRKETSQEILRLLRLNVVDKRGTGGRAAVAGYEVGGKTGTADIAGEGGYGGSGVLTSFLAVFPASAPRYLTFVMLFEPKASAATLGQRTAGMNAAPATAKLIERIAPLLGVAPGEG